MAGENFNGLVLIYGEGVLKKVKECEFHYNQSIEKKAKSLLSGLSDHHKLTTTILRKIISKGNSKKMFYRDYKRSDQKNLKLS